MAQEIARRPKGAATIHDVARRAGVSSMTVSRVINGETRVRAATRTRVDAAIRELNFAPNPAARTLAGGSALRLGLVLSIPNAAYLSEFLVGALERCSQINAQLIVKRYMPGEDLAAAADMLIDARLDGAILPPPVCDAEPLVARLRAAGIALIATGSMRPSNTLASIGIDDFAAARSMTRHLVRLGHRRIGFITGRPEHASSSLRLQGYRAAMEEAGLAVAPELVAAGTFTYHSGLDAAERLLGHMPMPSAIFASNDDMAAAAVAVAHRRGLDVPADLSVVGFDDTPLATTIWPELTTVRQPVSTMSEEAVTMLTELIREQRDGGGQEPPHRLLDFELIRRQSDAVPKSRPPAL
ncbi:LacI family DNA-binding transcriptional regulator [Sphingomonas parva]|uniref:LacI family DNA-binding transcriptional regulator n=1 Tax=Sphingomonas parva TaxID=2555898 RepID=A0A4Y8ZPN6_9SPHN|nr:LacI family DNA-binding transcriptional regulator [Sphingomonas parva]TFI57968.1 LacI family DNA-binding transcriptional regulator [Sphingomonas parva]